MVLFTGNQSISPEALKQRLKLKATRTANRGKQENNYPIKEEGRQLELRTRGKIFSRADDVLKYFSYLSQKTGFDISCTICMKCQILFFFLFFFFFLRKIRKISPICHLLKGSIFLKNRQFLSKKGLID